MIFNKGFMCKHCGPIKTAGKKAASKAMPARNVCPECAETVTPWERPMNERAGRCGNCANASFTSAFVKRQLLRCCKLCNEVVNIDKNCEIVRKGDLKHAIKKR